MSTIHLLLVDPDSRFIDLIEAQLESALDIEIVGHTTQHQLTLSLCAEYSPHILILGPGNGDSLPLIRDIRSQFPDVAVISVTDDVDTMDARQHLQAGVNGYLLRDDATDIIDAILTANQGKSIISTEVIHALL